MPPRPGKPKRPAGKRGGKPYMEPLFPELKKGAGKRPAKAEKKQDPRMLAVGRAHQIRRVLNELEARRYVERGQLETLREEITRILGLYRRGRLTKREANHFLNSTAWVLEYIKLLRKEKQQRAGSGGLFD